MWQLFLFPCPEDIDSSKSYASLAEQLPFSSLSIRCMRPGVSLPLFLRPHFKQEPGAWCPLSISRSPSALPPPSWLPPGFIPPRPHAEVQVGCGRWAGERAWEEMSVCPCRPDPASRVVGSPEGSLCCPPSVPPENALPALILSHAPVTQQKLVKTPGIVLVWLDTLCFVWWLVPSRPEVAELRSGIAPARSADGKAAAGDEG